MTEEIIYYPTYLPVLLPNRRALHGVFYLSGRYALPEGFTREKNIEAMQTGQRFWARTGNDHFCIVNLDDQPADDLVPLKVIDRTQDDAKERYGVELITYIEGSLGIEYELAQMVKDTQQLLWQSAAVMGELAEAEGVGVNTSSLLSSYTRSIVRIGYIMNQRLSVIDVARAMLRHIAAHHAILYSRVTDWRYNSRSDMLENRLHHLVQDRAHELVKYLDETTLKEAEDKVVADGNVLATYKRDNPGELEKDHNERFLAALRLWIEGYIPRDDFDDVTKFHNLTHHWTNPILAGYEKELAAKVKAEQDAQTPDE